MLRKKLAVQVSKSMNEFWINFQFGESVRLWHWSYQTSASSLRGDARQKVEFLPNKYHKKCPAKKLWRFSLGGERRDYITLTSEHQASNVPNQPER